MVPFTIAPVWEKSGAFYDCSCLGHRVGPFMFAPVWGTEQALYDCSC